MQAVLHGRITYFQRTAFFVTEVEILGAVHFLETVFVFKKFKNVYRHGFKYMNDLNFGCNAVKNTMVVVHYSSSKTGYAICSFQLVVGNKILYRLYMVVILSQGIKSKRNCKFIQIILLGCYIIP
jgi:hypothetical protein